MPTREASGVSVAFVWINSLTGLAGLLHSGQSLPAMLPWWLGVVAIGALLGTGVLTAYAVIKSKRLADLLDALSDESLSPSQRLRAIFGSWRRSA